jgi:uncharacterized protein
VFHSRPNISRLSFSNHRYRFTSTGFVTSAAFPSPSEIFDIDLWNSICSISANFIPMIGIIVQLLISWILVWLYEKNNLRVLGLSVTKRRIKDLFLFLFVTAACCASGFLFKMYFGGIRWELNPVLSSGLIIEGIWWNIRSVFFEELIFRGAIFYILIQKLGIWKAILISSAAFGIYHWFSYGIIGNIPQMIFVFFLTGIMGIVYAFGYARTMSLYIPVAIHFGWNFTHGFVFSEGSIGTGILRQTNNDAFRTGSYVVAFIVFILPMMSVMLINFYLIKRKKQVDIHIYRPNSIR